jgi:hypothetical protein
MTIHGAGHMAPMFKPPQTYHAVFSWLKKRDLFEGLEELI